MPIIWELLTDETRDQLNRYQWRWHRKKIAPVKERELVIVHGVIENLEEIDKIMRQARSRE